MNILYVGDVMGRPGRRVLARALPRLRITKNIDMVIAQAENVTHGKGMSERHYSELEEAGVDGFSGGNHTLERQDTIALVESRNTSVIAPANIEGSTRHNYKILKFRSGTVAIISLLGYTIPHGYKDIVANPLDEIDYLLPIVEKRKPNAVIVNIHGDISSEKVVMGHYLDGKVTAVIGDHWHTPTADERILPNGTAHITDVGMCGALNSSIGVEADMAIRRWRGEKVKNRMVETGALQFNAVLIGTNNNNRLAASIERIRLTIG